MQASPLDGFDRKILKVVQNSADLSADELGERIGLSASAALRRLKRLRDSGVIESTIAVVAPAAVGANTTFVVGLEVERERPEMLARLRKWFLDEDHVQQAYYVTGNWDFVLIVTAPSVEMYDALMSRLMSENPNVRRFTTNVALGTSKRTLLVPIPAA